MSGVKKTARKIHKSMRKLHRRLDPVGGYVMAKADKRVEKWTDKNIWAAMEPQVPEMAEAESTPVMPIPDVSGSETEYRRRRAKASKSGRQSTILTGLGG